MITISTLLKEKRSKHSIRWVERHSKLRRTTLCNLENGIINKRMSAEIIYDLAEWLELPVSYILSILYDHKG